uniref:Uncharacterized protein n=1 Tax=viral metagenome TaxID=1070528 RepID=A0A6C0J0W0_9ZZZZ
MENIITYIKPKESCFDLSESEKITLVNFIVNLYIQSYKHMYKYPKDGRIQEGIDWLHNDILKFIGIKWNLIKNNDGECVKKWEELNGILTENNEPNEELIKAFLLKLPNKEIHSLLGHIIKIKILIDPEKFLKNINLDNC